MPLTECKALLQQKTNSIYRLIFDPEAYFSDCYGINHDIGAKPWEVILKTLSDHTKYARALPLHHHKMRQKPKWNTPTLPII